MKRNKRTQEGGRGKMKSNGKEVNSDPCRAGTFVKTNVRLAAWVMMLLGSGLYPFYRDEIYSLYVVW